MLKKLKKFFFRKIFVFFVSEENFDLRNYFSGVNYFLLSFFANKVFGEEIIYKVSKKKKSVAKCTNEHDMNGRYTSSF